MRSQTTQQNGEERLLGMQTILRLVKDPAGRTLHHPGTDLLIAMGRQAVQHDRFGIRFCQQGLVQAKPFKRLLPLRLLLLLAQKMGVDTDQFGDSNKVISL